MFKKALAAVAVLGAFAGSSVAADVNLYGIVDYGMLYQNYEGVDGLEKEALTLDSGVSSASRFGLKGAEDLGNGFTVSFKLENGFNADDGKLGSDNQLFNREASLTVANAQYGALSFGRMGAVGSSAGTYDTVFAIADSFDGGDGAVYSGAMTSRYDNMVTYQSPKVAGLQAIAQYSFKIDSDKKNDDNEVITDELEGHRSADRYAALAVTGEYGAFQAVAAYEQTMFSTKVEHQDDAQIVSLGANYDFGVAKVFALGQYFENSRDITVLGNGYDVAEGYAGHVGAQVPFNAGLVTAALYYVDADNVLNSDSVESLSGSVKYEYPLSARTTLYSSVGYGTADYGDDDLDVTQIYAGITHTF